MSQPNKTTQAEFTAFYLQKLTQELSEDLEKVRNADDFKTDSVPFLVHALQQGARQFSDEQQERLVKAAKDSEDDDRSA
ncbi:Ribosome assembly protein 3 [Escovopsis weberi]|uniref:Ribosome assembly protein 3 n=1 Tax=Escovopsis weberi TaxID=150374 RepID=A0A0M8NAI7_ESCWE|nr:Ribosome assembly protein 3 [Escovopsis weberi]